MENVKIIIGENIAELRKLNKLTQQEFASALSYSDKSISKWERGESTPDIEILLKIADFFKVDIKYLLEKHSEEEKAELLKTEKKAISYKMIISLISCVTVWFIATVLDFIFKGILNKTIWIIYIWALPCSFIVLLVFASIWAKPKWIYITLSILLWTLITAFFLTFLFYTNFNFWYIYLVGAPLQVSIILTSLLTYRK